MQSTAKNTPPSTVMHGRGAKKATQNRQGALDNGWSTCLEIYSMYCWFYIYFKRAYLWCHELLNYIHRLIFNVLHSSRHCFVAAHPHFTQGTHSSSVPIAPLSPTFKLLVVYKIIKHRFMDILFIYCTSLSLLSVVYGRFLTVFSVCHKSPVLRWSTK